LRIDLFNEIAVMGDNILNLELEAVAGLRHGVPIEGPHHLLDLLDQVLGFVVRLCLDLRLSDATCKIVRRVAIRKDRRPDLLLPHRLDVTLIGHDPGGKIC
jgi:hypothetical protein